MAGTRKSVTIQIAPNDFNMLKDAKYKLCFAKKVNSTYNVVWQSYGDYLTRNAFSWTPQYQIFGSNNFQAGVQVSVDTYPPAPIGLGETVVLDKNGMLGTPFTGGPSTGITLSNQFGGIHPGLSSVSTGVHGKTVVTPIYVAADPIVIGPDVLTPRETVQVWFQQDVVTSTIFSSARSNSVEIDLTTSDSATWQYKDQQWSVPSVTAWHDPSSIMTALVWLTSWVDTRQLSAMLSAAVRAVYPGLNVTVDAVPGGVQIVITITPGAATGGAALVALGVDPVKPAILGALLMETLAAMGVGYTEFSIIA